MESCGFKEYIRNFRILSVFCVEFLERVTIFKDMIELLNYVDKERTVLYNRLLEGIKIRKYR